MKFPWSIIPHYTHCCRHLCLLYPGMRPEDIYTQKIHGFVQHMLEQIERAGCPDWVSCYIEEGFLGLTMRLSHGTRVPYVSLFRNTLLVNQLKIVRRVLFQNADENTKQLMLQHKRIFPNINAEERDDSAPRLMGLRRKKVKVEASLHLNVAEIDGLLDCLTSSSSFTKEQSASRFSSSTVVLFNSLKTELGFVVDTEKYSETIGATSCNVKVQFEAPNPSNPNQNMLCIRIGTIEALVSAKNVMDLDSDGAVLDGSGKSYEWVIIRILHRVGINPITGLLVVEKKKSDGRILLGCKSVIQPVILAEINAQVLPKKEQERRRRLNLLEAAREEAELFFVLNPEPQLPPLRLD